MEAAEEGCNNEDDLLEQCLGKEEQLSEGLDEKPKGGFDYTTCIPEYDIDLDREPEERWDQVAQDYLEHFPVLKEYSKMCAVVDFGGETLGPLLLGTCGKGLSLSSSFNGMMSADMRRELQGIAKHTESIGMGFEDLLVLNAGYDLLARCTSIVTEGPDGTPMQIRNLDWDLDHLRDLTINCNFKKNGRTLYKATMHAGLTGIFTGMRMCSEENPEEGYSLSLNYRKTGGSLSLGYNLLQLMNGGWGIGFFIREALTKMATYQEAVEFLSSGPLMAPCYISIAGIQKGHGALITRDRKGETNRLELSDERPFLLVTNIDHWQDAVDPDWAEGDPLLLNSIERRTAATESIRALHERWQEKKDATSGCCLEEFVHSCFEVLGGAPVCNVQTVYSAVLSPAFSLYRIHLLKKPLSGGDALYTEDKTKESI